jgi:hypothetical protein
MFVQEYWCRVLRTKDNGRAGHSFSLFGVRALLDTLNKCT